MDWVEQLNAAMDYIESHLREAVRYEDAARIAGCSACHFQRMFTYLAGIPLSEYIRRRRMSLRRAASAQAAEGNRQVASVRMIDEPATSGPGAIGGRTRGEEL